jgi:hypothetical protein
MKNYISNSMSNTIMPFNFYSNANQVITYIVLSKLGIKASVIAIIIMFL